jgi:esterase/lipase superfamily enzyme
MEVKALEKCVLVMAVNADSIDYLEQEAATIQKHLQIGRKRKNYVVKIVQGISIDDLAKYLPEYQPAIVHLLGRKKFPDVILKTEQHQIQQLTPEKLANLFSGVVKPVECVVINNWFSLETADELSASVRCLIGIEEEVGDRSVTFTSEFYQGLGQGKGYYQAFELGCAQLPANRDTPRFITCDQTILEISEEQPPHNIRRGSNLKSIESLETILYPLWYGTNRKPIDLANINKGFSGERDNQLHYGSCQVAIPKSHIRGSIGSSWWKRILTATDDRLKLDQDSLQGLMAESFWEDIKQALNQQEVGERIALVYIHGFNVSFEEAALTAAQIGFDLKFLGITAFYSWPSKGKLMGYAADEATIQASENHIAQFLIDFVAESGAERVHIIAHSMGNRGLLRSLQRIANEFQSQSIVPFGQIFLAAPDEDPDVFCNLASIYQTLSERTTLYVSSKDKALFSSGIIHDRPRTGFTPPITTVSGIDTIDVSHANLTLLGHGYFSDTSDVLHDISDLLLYGTSPDRRFGLEKVETATQKYWVIGR